MNIFDLQATISLNAANFESGIQQAQTAFEGLSNTVSPGAVALGTAVGNMVTSAASDLGDFVKDSIQTGISFDDSMSKVKAISGATEEEFQALREAAIKWGGDTKFHASEVADAFTYMAMAGWKTEDMLDGIGAILNLAAASGEGLATTSDIVTDALTGFGYTAKDASHFADVLAAASSNANTNVAMMGETFKYVAPVAGALKFSGDDVAAAIGLMANAGIKGSRAGTALRAAISKLIDPSDDAAVVLKKLGLLDLADGAEEFTADLTKLEDEMRAVDEKTAALEKAQTKYNEAVQKHGQNSTQATEAYKKVEKATYNLQKAENKLQEGKDAQLRSQFEINTLLVKSDGTAQEFSHTIEALRQAFAGLTEAQQTEYAATLFGQEAYAGMLAIINASEEDMGKLTGAIAEASDGLGAAAEMAGEMENNLGGDLRSLDSALEAFKLSVINNADTPLRDLAQTSRDAVLAITQGFNEGGISGAFSAFGQFAKDTFSDFIENSNLSALAIEQLASVTGTSVGTISELLSQFKGVSSDAISGIAVGFKKFLEAFDNADSYGVISMIAFNAKKLFEAFATGNAELIGSLAGKVKGFIDGFNDSGAVEAIASAAVSVGDFLNTFLRVSADVIESIAKNTKKFIDAFDEAEIGNIIGEIATNAAELFDAFAKVGEDAIEDIGKGLEIFFDSFDKEGLADAITDIFHSCSDLFGEFTDAVAETVKKVGENFDGFGTTVAEVGATSPVDMGKIGEAISGLIDNMTELAAKFEELTRPIREFFGGALGAMIQTAVGWFVGGFGDMANAIADLIDFYNDLVDIIQAVMEGDIPGAFEAAKDAFNDFKEFWSDAWHSLEHAWDGAKEAFDGIGRDLVQGLWDGFVAKWDEFKRHVKKLTSGLTSLVMGIFGEHSPSKVFAGIGMNLVTGMEKGWSSEFGDLERMVGNDVSSLTGTARIGFEDSAIGRSSAAGITSMLTANSGASTQPVEVNLVLDGEVAAKVLYDPLRNVAWQKGKAEPVYA